MLLPLLLSTFAAFLVGSNHMTIFFSLEKSTGLCAIFCHRCKTENYILRNSFTYGIAQPLLLALLDLIVVAPIVSAD